MLNAKSGSGRHGPSQGMGVDAAWRDRLGNLHNDTAKQKRRQGRRFRDKTKRERAVLQAHRDTALAHALFGLLHGEFAVVEDAGSQYCIGTALLHAIGQVVKVAHAA